MITLKGITWGHTRGLVPLQATAQRFSEINPGVRIDWTVRSLMDFGEQSIEQLTENFDLLVIDHPFIGQAVHKGIFQSYDDLLPADFLHEQALHSVGQSHSSYNFAGRQWALAIDTASPVSHRREDLFEKAGEPLPQNYEDVLRLARASKVLVPGIHTDAIHNFYMFCHAYGETPFANEDKLVSREAAEYAIDRLCELMELVPKACRQMNPITILELLSEKDDHWYCPFAFGYSTYSQPGFARHIVHSGDLVKLNGKHLLTTLGGAGLVISHTCQHLEIAANYARFVAEPNTQQHIYRRCGGQPGHRSAWLSTIANNENNNYFADTLPALDRAWLRPRYNGYLHFQDHASHIISAVQVREISRGFAIKELERLYHESISQDKY